MVSFLVADRTMIRPIEDDGHPDIASYNQELEQRGNPVWHDVPWLYAECYLCMLQHYIETSR